MPDYIDTTIEAAESAIREMLPPEGKKLFELYICVWVTRDELDPELLGRTWSQLLKTGRSQSNAS